MAVTLTTPNTLLGVFQPKGDAAKLASTLATVVLGTLLLTICAKINVPVWPVPVTLQSFAVAALAAAFGARIGVATVALYLVEGALGLPVFALGGGLAYLVGPTSGFLFGFLAMAAIIGFAADRGASGKPLTLFAAMLAGGAVMFALGFASAARHVRPSRLDRPSQCAGLRFCQGRAALHHLGRAQNGAGRLDRDRRPGPVRRQALIVSPIKLQEPVLMGRLFCMRDGDWRQRARPPVR
ncbi:biotin transporter BioY [Devosia sp. A8/3-2]|nr:biotin transporter BioY [Devosia sp. A8/3-2]